MIASPISTFFERPEDWAEFQRAGHLEQWTGGLHSEGSLFIQSDPSHKFSGHSLGHEIAHLLLYRSYGHNIPTWLNEGFAECISRNSRASYQRARHYLAKAHSSSLAPGELIPLPELMSLPRAPDHRVDLFYDECERLVRFLVQSDHERFRRFLDALAKKQGFDQALLQTYAGIFSSRADFDTRFEAYATKDYSTTLQDQEEE